MAVCFPSAFQQPYLTTIQLGDVLLLNDITVNTRDSGKILLVSTDARAVAAHLRLTACFDGSISSTALHLDHRHQLVNCAPVYSAWRTWQATHRACGGQVVLPNPRIISCVSMTREEVPLLLLGEIAKSTLQKYGPYISHALIRVIARFPSNIQDLAKWSSKYNRWIWFMGMVVEGTDGHRLTVYAIDQDFAALVGLQASEYISLLLFGPIDCLADLDGFCHAQLTPESSGACAGAFKDGGSLWQS